MIPTGLNDNIIYQTGNFVKTFQHQMELAFRKAGLDITAEQFNLLTLLWYQDGLSQQHLSKTIGRDKTTVSRVLDRMIKRDLVERIPGEDKRERLIYLTDHGKSIQHKLVTISATLYMKAIQGLSNNKLLETIDTLVGMTKNLK